MSRVYESIEDQLTEKITNASNTEIEEFLGYQLSADIIESGLEERVREVLDHLSEEEMIKYEKIYGIKTYEVPQRVKAKET